MTVFSNTTRQGTLVFRNVSVEYNNTNIQCRATLSNGETVDSNNVTLLVQGERETSGDALLIREKDNNVWDNYVMSHELYRDVIV